MIASREAPAGKLPRLLTCKRARSPEGDENSNFWSSFFCGEAPAGEIAA